MNSLSLLAPELLLTLAGAGLLLGESQWTFLRRTWLWPCAAALAGAAVLALKAPAQDGVVFGMLAQDGLARCFKVSLLTGVLAVVALSAAYQGFRSRAVEKNGGLAWGSYGALLLFSTVGLLLLVSSVDLLMVLVAIELVSITSFILTGYLKHDRRSAEAAVKFFLAGALSSGLMVYGMSLLYGLLGSTRLDALLAPEAAALPRLPLAGGILFLLAGMGFKLAMAPFHMWVPDAYEGAPTPVTAYLSVAPKVAVFALFLRVFPNLDGWGLSTLLAALAVLTMTAGNFAALKQTNVKRMLGYSSIAQMGYLLVGVVAGGPAGAQAGVVYAVVYLFMNLGAFACIIAVGDESETDHIDGFSGLAERSLGLALVTALFFMSLTGLPPLAGFIGKFSLFASAVEKGWIWLAAAGLINSVVSLYYYFSVIHRMFFVGPVRSGRVALSAPLAGCVAAALLVTVGAGLFPQRLLAWVREALP